MTATLLSQIPLFAQVGDQHLVALAGMLRRKAYTRGEVVFQQGDPGSALFVIEHGQVKIRIASPDGKEVILALLGPGDFFGELALLDGEPRSADAVAIEASELLALYREDFLRCVRDEPQLGTNALAALSRRLRRTDQIVHDAVFLDVRARLVRVLLDLAETRGRPGPDGIEIDTPLTQGVLAEMIGATRESVNKWLKVLEREGAVRQRRDRFTLLDPDRLRRGLS